MNEKDEMPTPTAPEPSGEDTHAVVGVPAETARPSPPAVPVTLAAPPSDEEVEREMSRMSRRSFLWGSAALAVGFTGWRWLISRRADGTIPWPFRRALETNEQFARDYFRPNRLSPTFPRLAAGMPRANGGLGMSDDFDPDEWKLTLEGAASSDDALTFTLDEIKKLPRVEMVTELKCIEGWSQVVQWAGARLSDFLAAHPPADSHGKPIDVVRNPHALPPYVSLETPDSGYYVGLEMESALHPQTLLCYEMNGEPLADEHGAPLRLTIPVKYGIKSIKRIGKIRYATQRPADYWAERGYDWYAGH